MFLQLCLNLHSSCSCALVSSANILVRTLVVDCQLTLIFILWYLYLSVVFQDKYQSYKYEKNTAGKSARALVNSLLLFVLSNPAPPIVVTCLYLLLCHFPLHYHCCLVFTFPNDVSFFLDIVKHLKCFDCNIGLEKHVTLLHP